jgi:hypothetical protein
LLTLGSYATDGVAFATHSLGLARAVSERVYSVRRVRQGLSEVRPLEAVRDLAAFLGELGFSAYYELGTRRVLLVEGPKDVLVAQVLLRKYNAEHDFVVLPLGGSSMIHGGSAPLLEQVKRLSTDIYVLIDSERSGAQAALPDVRKAFADVCEELGVRVHVLERRATENYLTQRAVERAKGGEYRALEPYEKLADVEPHWNKEENWRIAQELDRGEVDETDLGRFFATITQSV